MSEKSNDARPEIESVERMLELREGAAGQFAREVHRALLDDADRRETSSGDGETYWRISASFQQFNGYMANRKNLSGKYEDPDEANKLFDWTSANSFKSLLPEIATVALRDGFSTIHDQRDGADMTIDELKDFASRCTSDKPLDKLALDYAIKHFSQIQQLDPNSKGITLDALSKAVEIFVDHERQEEELSINLQKPLPFLDRKFESIASAKHPSVLTKFDINKYRDSNCAQSPEKQDYLGTTLNYYGNIKNFDPADGDRNWYSAWLTKGNADGITRSDIAQGLKRIAALEELERKYTDTWTK